MYNSEKKMENVWVQRSIFVDFDFQQIGFVWFVA